MLITDWKINPVVDRTRDEWYQIFGLVFRDGVWVYPEVRVVSSDKPKVVKVRTSRIAWDESVLAAEVARINKGK